MKSLWYIAIFFLVSFVNAQSPTQEELSAKLQHYLAKESSGKTMVLVSIPIAAIGGVLYYDGFKQIEANGLKQESPQKILGGLVLMVAGEILFDIGLVNWIIGYSRAKHYRRLLEKREEKQVGVQFNANGLRISYKF